jgi:hypothetical protein
MTTLETGLPVEARSFVDRVVSEAQQVFRTLRSTGTLTANGTVAAVERVPGLDAYVALTDPGPWALDQSVKPTVVDFEGNTLYGSSRAGEAFGFAKILRQHQEITSVVHVHSTYLATWSQSQRPLPIRYVPVQRFTLANEIPVYIDRRGTQVDFILEELKKDIHAPAILEGNGGATVWGTRGLLDTAQFIVLLEEGAKLQVLAEALGGSQPFGPGVLRQAWGFHGLLDQAKVKGLLPDE